MKVVIIDYNAGNVCSVQFALERIGVQAVITSDADKIIAADKVIFPGVGEAKTTMNYLRSTGLEKLIPNLKQPVLGVCLGMQLMCSYSEEGDVDCLSIFDEKVLRFKVKESYKVPHMGWNTLYDTKSVLFEGIPSESYVYFVHSFYADAGENTIAVCDYMHPFSAALNKDNFYATQFHPEKSGDIGERIVRNFIEKT